MYPCFLHIHESFQMRDVEIKSIYFLKLIVFYLNFIN